MSHTNGKPKDRINVLGGKLEACCFDPMTGFHRTGYCVKDERDFGTHIVCAQVTADFLQFSSSRGNDLVTPRPEHDFPGLKPGDRWCLCASRWKEALDAGVAPPVILEATETRALQYVSRDTLLAYAIAI